MWMQRVRIGMTGLAIVFLLVLLGTAISRSGGDAPPAQPQVMANGQVAEPNEPLAELGVAPGESAADNADNSASNR
jgi:hypothetical protein